MPVDIPIDKIVSRVSRGIARGIVRGTESVRNEAVRAILNPPKTGRIYRRRGVDHQASAPGEAPASDTGRLVNSIATSYSEDGQIGRVSAHTEYAAHLEFGTVKMEPRPFMRPALEAKRKEIAVDIAREITSALRHEG